MNEDIPQELALRVRESYNKHAAKVVSVTEALVASKVTMQRLMTPEQFDFMTTVFDPTLKSKQEAMMQVMLATLADEGDDRNAFYVLVENPSEIYCTGAASERVAKLFAEARDSILRFAPAGTKEKYFEASIEAANITTDHADKVKSGKLVRIL